MGNIVSCLFPFSVWDCWWLAPLALLLDLCLGDPRLPWPHPVCALGRLLHWLEGPARHWMTVRQDNAENTTCSGLSLRGRLAGLVCLLCLLAVTAFVVRLCLALPLLGTLAAIYLAWAGLAAGSLLRTGSIVLRRVETCSLAGGREALSWLVSRDTSQMDRPLMRKTLADTLSENFTDAVVAPFFWLLLTGPVGLWLYKAVSTTDSMWGYLTPRWRWLGWAGARADDMLAFIPARLSAALLWLTDTVLQHWRAADRIWSGHWPGVRVLASQAKGMPSPNSGWSMATCAWLCGARMAGPSVYFGQMVQKPWLGPPQSEASPWDTARLHALCALIRQGTILGGLSLWVCCLALRLVV